MLSTCILVALLQFAVVGNMSSNKKKTGIT